MSSAPLPQNEDRRLATLRSLAILDTPESESFNDVVDALRSILRAPIAVISLIDSRRQWFKASRGAPFREAPREFSICAHTILSQEVLIVEDLSRDPRFASNPFVLGAPGLRFYAGAPILTPMGDAIGAVCVMDTAPRFATQSEVKLLRLFARHTFQLMELHRLQAALRTPWNSDGIAPLM